ncbi:MAG TPA: hypothetical protein VFZ34_08255 [Blastocatellia bacterium]|nr:hypothetical protein [Blastocatellia bacterium]
MKPRTSKQPAQQYDITVKELLQAAPPKLLELVLGAKPAEILTVELPKVRPRRPDFVARTIRDEIKHLEVQSDNDEDMEWRMLEYYPLLRKLFGRSPIQCVLYLGQKPLKMAGYIDEPNLQFRYEVIDLRDLDAEVLLQSPSVDDRIMAILCHANDERLKVRRILKSLRPLPAKIQGDKITQLLILSRLRGLTDMITNEVKKQNILTEIIAESPFLTELTQKLVQKKTKEVLAQKELEAEAKLLTRQLEALHGKLPKWAKEKIATANKRTLEKWAVRLLKAKTLEEALR